MSRNDRLGFFAATGLATLVLVMRLVKETFVRFIGWVAAVMAWSSRISGWGPLCSMMGTSKASSVPNQRAADFIFDIGM